MEERLLDALDSVTWYNGLAPYVFNWMFVKPTKSTGYIFTPNGYLSDGGEEECQLQVLWMIAVELFGDCGTSPRSGWIEDVDGFREWCLRITRTWRSSEEYDGPKKYRHSWAEECE